MRKDECFYMVNGCIHWRYPPPLWVFPPPTWGMCPCIIVIIGNALGDTFVYDNLRAVEKVKIYDEISCKSLRYNINHCWERKKEWSVDSNGSKHIRTICLSIYRLQLNILALNLYPMFHCSQICSTFSRKKIERNKKNIPMVMASLKKNSLTSTLKNIWFMHASYCLSFSYKCH